MSWGCEESVKGREGSMRNDLWFFLQMTVVWSLSVMVAGNGGDWIDYIRATE